MTTPQAELVVRDAVTGEKRYRIEPGAYLIGRDATCQIQVDDQRVSGRHALLTFNPHHIQIEDLGSANGTFVNGQPVTGTLQLDAEQPIQIGDCIVQIRPLAVEEAETMVSPAEHKAPLPSRHELLKKPRNYEIQGELARGCMGVVLEARDQNIRRQVAIKRMLGSAEDAVENTSRFLDEGQITGQLEHPNIVPVHELGVDEHGQPFYTMKLVKGVTLKEVLDNIKAGKSRIGEHYTLAQLLTVFQKVCDAIAFAHAHHVVHRDLKPENVMLGAYGEVLVMDWGLAKVLPREAAGKPAGTLLRNAPISEPVTPVPGADASRTMDGTIMGTPHFMAPEQAEGDIHLIDARTDIYALGGILYNILTLQPPVTGNDVQTVLAKVRQGAITPPSQHAPVPHCPDEKIPEALAAIAMKALQKSRLNRYQSVQELQLDIEAYQNGFATSAENAGAWRQFVLLVKRHKVITASTVLIVALTAVFVTTVIRERNHATQALAELRRTAPTFAAQARSLIEEQKFDEALDKIGFAIKLDEKNAGYHLFRANTLQALTRLPEAVAAYRQVLALRGDDAAAKLNLDLCEKLLAENGGNHELTAPVKTKLLDALLAQKRQADAVPLSKELKRDADTAEALIKSRLKVVMAQPGWNEKRLTRLPDGTFKLNLGELKVPDIGFLSDLPISDLDLGGCAVTDFQPLHQIPLRRLSLSRSPASNFDALRGLNLQYLNLQQTKVADLSPLLGMPLKRLELPGTSVTDLKPLRDMPLEELYLHDTRLESLDVLQKLPLRELSLFRTPVADLSPLRGSPVKNLWLFRCDRLRDLSPLADMPALENLIVPSHISDIAFLKKLPHLKRLSQQSIEDFNWSVGAITPVAEFWKKNGDRLARQVPQEKQLEKFRQSLIAEGNDPDKVPHFAFGADGSLQIKLQSPEIWKCSDLSELRGVAFTAFICNRPISDLSALSGAPLKYLVVSSPSISDLSPLRGAHLDDVFLGGTQVRDLSPLLGQPLRKIVLTKTSVEDVTVLTQFPTLEEVILPSAAKNVEALKALPKLRRISYWGSGPGAGIPAQTAAEFWKEFDAKKSKKP